MAKKLKYEDVKYYIEIESNSGCKLLSNEYKSTKDKIHIQCSCGNTFFRTFGNFKRHKQYKCELCINRINWNYDRVKNFIEINSNGECELLSTEYIGSIKKLHLKCKCGIDFYKDFNNLKHRKQYKCNKCFYNSKWNYNKVKKFIEIDSNSHCILLSNTYIDIYTNLKIQCKCGNIFYRAFNIFKKNKPYKCDECKNKSNLNIPVDILIANLGYELVGEYKDTHTKITIKDDNNYYYTPYIKHLSKHKPYAFSNSNIYTIDNIKNWTQLNHKQFLLISEKYTNAKTLLKWKCLKCGDYFNASWDIIYHGYGCGVCHGKQVGISNCLATKNPELVKEWHPTKNGDLTPYDVTYASNQKFWWICKKNHEWQDSLSHRNNDRNCPFCSQSKGEKIIGKILKENNINFITQKRFSNLKGTGNGFLSYDFYISDLNTLIEFNGLQHYESVDYFGGEEQFKIQQEHDRRKHEYAKNNNINLLIISCWDFDNIEKILQIYKII